MICSGNWILESGEWILILAQICPQMRGKMSGPYLKVREEGTGEGKGNSWRQANAKSRTIGFGGLDFGKSENTESRTFGFRGFTDLE